MFGLQPLSSSQEKLLFVEFHDCHTYIRSLVSSQRLKEDKSIFLELLLLVICLANSSHSSLSELRSLCHQLNKTASQCLDCYSLCHGLPMYPGIKPGELLSPVHLFIFFQQSQACAAVKHQKTVVPCILSSFLIVNNERIYLDLFTLSWEGSLSSIICWHQGSPFILG